jgi:YidC/Oxa1 family membrane protein insertase
MIVAALLAGLILFGWPYLVSAVYPQAAAPPAVTRTADGAVPAAGAPAAVPGEAPAATTRVQSVEAALAGGQRVAVETTRLRGSINLVGARIDDIVLTRHRATIERNSPNVRLFAPGGTRQAYFAGLGWSGTGTALPTATTVWTASAPRLTPTTPVTLSWDNGAGQLFEIMLSVDADSMFTARQRVTNRGAAPVALGSYAFLNRTLLSPDPSSWTIHSGAMGVFNGVADYSIDADAITEAGAGGVTRASTGGWLGFSDKYWLGAIIPAQSARVTAAVRQANGLYQANFAAAPQIIAPGRAVTQDVRIFAGAKDTSLLDAYAAAGIPNFDLATDWGWFKWFEKPIYYVLEFFFRLIGNFGLAIMLLTLSIRLLMFPIAQKQFTSMAQMRVVQPKLKAMQDKYKDDKPRLQQEMMALYKAEKINPLAGCLPIVIQIPIFYALYKVLLLSVEMRHQPFIAWIRDLSAPDPAHILNLFGLIPFTPPAFLGIGVLAVLLGVTMWAQFKLNPPPTDPVQQQVFSIMPWMLMFVMAPFAAGLLLYWITNNLLSIGQQRLLYMRYPEMKLAAAAK